MTQKLNANEVVGLFVLCRIDLPFISDLIKWYDIKCTKFPINWLAYQVFFFVFLFRYQFAVFDHNYLTHTIIKWIFHFNNMTRVRNRTNGLVQWNCQRWVMHSLAYNINLHELWNVINQFFVIDKSRKHLNVNENISYQSHKHFSCLSCCCHSRRFLYHFLLLFIGAPFVSRSAGNKLRI